MTELLFYHLERDPLERVLPPLLERSLARGWRCIVEAPSTERLEALDHLLWTYRDESFLPHAREGAAPAERQPILLTSQPGNPNRAHVRFYVDGARLSDCEGYERLVYLFDGGDDHAVQTAREMWKWAQAQTEAQTQAFEVTYWRQSSAGGWERKA